MYWKIFLLLRSALQMQFKPILSNATSSLKQYNWYIFVLQWFEYPWYGVDSALVVDLSGYLWIGFSDLN